jgi:hypothetical protein
MIKITLKDGHTYDIVEETEDVYFYIGLKGFNKYVPKHKVVKVEEFKTKHKKSILLNFLILFGVIILIASYYL